MAKVPTHLRHFDLSGRMAVITGGASGIGLAAARALGDCGAALELISTDA